MIMRPVLSFLLTLILSVYLSTTNMIYHENSYVKFIGEHGDQNDYFGYSVLLMTDGLYIGAPKAINDVRFNRSAGTVFVCSLDDLDAKEVTCKTLWSQKRKRKFQPYVTGGLLKNNSWFGSSMAFLTDKVLLVTAPRLKSRYTYPRTSTPLQGACYLFTSKRSRPLEPLAEEGKPDHQTFVLDGSRPSYGVQNQSVYNYNLGQAGFSMAITKNNTVLLGAPGLMDFTGGIISYSVKINKTATNSDLQPISNPYYTTELDTDDYFGYSVESGIFEPNGSLLHIGGAPRSDLGRGKVLVFSPPTDSDKPLDIKAILKGPHVGSYFGASLCCMDINNDGRDDLLVGAPTYVKSDDILPYDQGAVFVYISKEAPPGFVLEEAGSVLGSELNGAKFGTAITDLGDIDGDGYRDVAIGAPWESDGVGAVYVYKGNAKGLNKEKVQRIQPADARGFGWALTKGVDVDNNNCNDLAIGAYESGASYLYRCIPTVSVKALIRTSQTVQLSYNMTSFTAMFCVCVLPTKFGPYVKLNLTGKIKIDPEYNRSSVAGDSQYMIIATPGNEICDEKTIKVNHTADLYKPIHMIFELEEDKRMQDNATVFIMDAARLSNDSTLKTVLPVRIERNCGNKKACGSSLNMTLVALNNPYVPGAKKQFGVKVKVWNTAEPAYDAMLIISVPMKPRKIPFECTLQNLTMTCEIPQPLRRNESIEWKILMDYNLLTTTANISLPITATIVNKYKRIRSTEIFQKVFIDVTPKAIFSINGKSMPNSAMTISRNNLAAGRNISFKHLFEITNYGPSDCQTLIAQIKIPEKAHLNSPITHCYKVNFGYECIFSIPAKVSYAITISLQMELSQEGNFLKRNTMYNATSSIVVLQRLNPLGTKNIGYEVTTTLNLEPAKIIWCIIIPCVFLGLLILSIIIRLLYKCGFFLRKYSLIPRDVIMVEKENQNPNFTSKTTDQSLSQTFRESDITSYNTTSASLESIS